MNVICGKVNKIASEIGILLCRAYSSDLMFVPKCSPITHTELVMLKDFLYRHNNICVLTGAGISTESGIPDYRSEGVGIYARSNRKPILYQDFCRSETVRKRYWARNYIGWPRFSSVNPNIAHVILKNLEDENIVKCIITQNVDNLHTKAGSKKVIELHGTAFKVMCLDCDTRICRFDFQDTLSKKNPNITITNQMIRPDGDVDLLQEQVECFQIPLCEKCGGILKPDIIFFGDNVPHPVLQKVKYNVDSADALLVLGTTLSTFSAYRIILQANDVGKPIAILNIGKTRADYLANIKVEGRCAIVLQKLYQS